MLVESGEVPGVSDDLRHTEARMDILAFSDQHDLNELICLDCCSDFPQSRSGTGSREGDATKYAGTTI